MPAYAVLIRGINVGSHKRLAMADLRALLAAHGGRDVRTHLNSGNAVFTHPDADADALAAMIERALEAELGLRVGCLVRTDAELRAVVAENPLPEYAAEGAKLLVHFLSAAPDPAVVAENDPSTLDPDTIVLGHRVIYQWCPNGVLKAPPAGGFAEKRWGVTVTARNWNTVTRLADLLPDA